MDPLETKTAISPDVTELQEQVESLQHLLATILLLVVVVSCTVSIYLYRQWRMTSKDLTAIRPGATQYINEYTRDRKPRMDAFVEKMKEYGRTDPNFMPILVRHGLATNVPSGGPSPAPAPSPSNLIAPKK